MPSYRVPITKAVRAVVLARDGHVCTTCGSTIALVLHHVRYHCDGGADTDDNLTTLCWVCHLALHEATETSMFLRLTAYKAIRRKREALEEIYGRFLAGLYGQEAFPAYLDIGFLTILLP